MSDVPICIDCGHVIGREYDRPPGDTLCRECYSGRYPDSLQVTAKCTGMIVWHDETQQWKQVYP